MSSSCKRLSDTSSSQCLTSTDPENQRAGSLRNGSSRLGFPFNMPLPTITPSLPVKKKHSLLHNLYGDEGHKSLCQEDKVCNFFFNSIRDRVMTQDEGPRALWVLLCPHLMWSGFPASGAGPGSVDCGWTGG